MPQQICNEFRSHWDNDGDWNPAETGSGNDEITLNIPSGQTFSHYELKIESNTMGSSANVTQAPSTGATGQQKIKVNWNFNPFGKIAYRVLAFSGNGSTQPVEVIIGPPNAPQTALDLIKQKKPFKLVLSGPNALMLFNVFRQAGNQSPLGAIQNQASMAIGAAEVSMAAVICATIVAIAFLVVILAICLYAIHSHYHAEVKYHRNGPMPFDDRLEIILIPV